MPKRILVLAVALLSLTAVAVAGPNQSVTGSWETHVMGTRITAQVNQDGERITGVVKVHNPVGKKDTYHFQGGINGNRLWASHFSGHSFQGSVSPQGHISGVLKTKGGHQIPLNVGRR